MSFQLILLALLTGQTSGSGELEATPAEKAASNELTIEKPRWARRPMYSDVVLAYPKVAYKAYKSGQVSVNCIAQGDGSFKTCRIVEENPKRFNFGWAALAVAFKYRLEPQLEDGTSVEGHNVTVRIRFKTDPN